MPERKRVLLYGKVGVGKSTLTEKTCGVNDISMDHYESVTRSSRTYPSIHPELSFTDAPGNNDDEDPMDHNLWIAQAMNAGPLSMIALVVKADKRLPNMTQGVKELASSFLDFHEYLCIVITHADLERTWSDQVVRDSLSAKLSRSGVSTNHNDLLDSQLC